MPNLWGSSCFPCHLRRKDRKSKEHSVEVTEKDGAKRPSFERHPDDMSVDVGSDSLTVHKWKPGRPGIDQITKPKPVRVHLRRPSSMGLGYKVGLVYDDRMCAHSNVDPRHPEKPQRISAIYECLEAAGIVDRCELVKARAATLAELSCVHSMKHIDTMRSLGSHTQDKYSFAAMARRYDSIYFNEGSSSSALLAAGSCVELAVKVARGELGAGAAVVRPPGHHAEADAAMGFCLFNNVAIAAHNLIHCQPALGIQKVLIVDWDVHHGNGTQHMFWKDPFVLYFSIHRYGNGFYPLTEDGDSDKVGEGAGKGFNVNVPLQRPGYGDLDYLAVFDHLLMPIAQQFNPDMVLISAGFDSAAGDPLGDCEISPAGYFQMTQRLMSLAGGRVVLALEGGYNLTSIATSYLACMKALLGETFEGKIHLELRTSTWSLIRDVRAKLLPFWSSLSKVLAEQAPEHFDIAEDEGLDSAYQDSVSVSEESGDELEHPAEDGLEGLKSPGIQLEEHPGDLLSQMRYLEKSEEARLSSVQFAEVDGLAHGISNLSVQNGEQKTESGLNVGNRGEQKTDSSLNAGNPREQNTSSNLSLENGGEESSPSNSSGENGGDQSTLSNSSGENGVQHTKVQDELSQDPVGNWEAILDASVKSFKDP